MFLLFICIYFIILLTVRVCIIQKMHFFILMLTWEEVLIVYDEPELGWCHCCVEGLCQRRLPLSCPSRCSLRTAWVYLCKVASSHHCLDLFFCVRLHSKIWLQWKIVVTLLEFCPTELNTANRCLMSPHQSFILVSHSKLKTKGCCAFDVVAPKLSVSFYWFILLFDGCITTP